MDKQTAARPYWRRWTTYTLPVVFGILALWALATPPSVVRPATATYRGAVLALRTAGTQLAPTPLPTATATPTPLPTTTPTPFPWPSLAPVPAWSPEQIIRDSVVTPSGNLFQNMSDWFNRENTIFSQTEATATYANDTVLLVWRVILTIVNALLILFLFFAAYEFFFASLTTRYISVLETVPRVLLAFVGANISILFAQFWIELNNILCRILLALSNQHPFPVLNLALLLNSPLSLPVLLLFLALCVLTVFLALEIIAREGLLIVLIVFLSLFFLLLANRRTQRLGQLGIGAFLATTFLQFFQLATMTIGTLLLIPFIQLQFTTGGTGLAPISTLLGCLAVFWITLLLPRMLNNWILAPIAESGRGLAYLATYGALRLLI